MVGRRESSSGPNISFVRPTFPNESRVAILPGDLFQLVEAADVTIHVETGFGSSLGIADAEYEAAGAKIAIRKHCYTVGNVFNLKLTQPEDYDLLFPGQTLIGWTHPNGSGSSFFREVCVPLNLRVIDIDSVSPRIYDAYDVSELDFLPKQLFWKNSYYAGIASVGVSQPWLPAPPSSYVAVLGSGSVAQGAFFELSRRGYMPRMFYRKTMDLFYEELPSFDLIVSGIEVGDGERPILSYADLLRTKPSALIIDAAADANRSIEGTTYRDLLSPRSEVSGRSFVLVNNAPSVLAQLASEYISSVVGTVLLPALIERGVVR